MILQPRLPLCVRVSRLSSEFSSDLLKSRSTEVAVWVVRAGPGGEHACLFEEAGFVAIQDLGVGDLSDGSRREIALRVAQALPADSTKVFQVAAMFRRFVLDIRVGDRVLTPDSQAGEIIFGEVSGEYEHEVGPRAPGYVHVRAVHWLGRVKRSELAREMLGALSAPQTVFQPAAQHHWRRSAIWERDTVCR